MIDIVLPALAPQSRTEQRGALTNALSGEYRSDEYIWIVGALVTATKGKGYTRELMWVPMMTPAAHIPYWRVCGDKRPAALELTLLASAGELAAFLIPPSGVKRLSNICALYEWSVAPRRWRCEHCDGTFMTNGAFEPCQCPKCGHGNELLNEE